MSAIQVQAITFIPIFAPMKFFVFIFSFYLLALSCMPCADLESCNLENQKRTFNSTTSSHSHQNDDTENCSPFCICACCGQSIATLFYPVNFVCHSPNAIKTFPIYSSSAFPEVYFNIWQPPKIS